MANLCFRRHRPLWVYQYPCRGYTGLVADNGLSHSARPPVSAEETPQFPTIHTVLLTTALRRVKVHLDLPGQFGRTNFT
jgi:hypothetical protein